MRAQPFRLIHVAARVGSSSATFGTPSDRRTECSVQADTRRSTRRQVAGNIRHAAGQARRAQRSGRYTPQRTSAIHRRHSARCRAGAQSAACRYRTITPYSRLHMARASDCVSCPAPLMAARTLPDTKGVKSHTLTTPSCAHRQVLRFQHTIPIAAKQQGEGRLALPHCILPFTPAPRSAYRPRRPGTPRW